MSLPPIRLFCRGALFRPVKGIGTWPVAGFKVHEGAVVGVGQRKSGLAEPLTTHANCHVWNNFCVVGVSSFGRYNGPKWKRGPEHKWPAANFLVTTDSVFGFFWIRCQSGSAAYFCSCSSLKWFLSHSWRRFPFKSLNKKYFYKYGLNNLIKLTNILI